MLCSSESRTSSYQRERQSSEPIHVEERRNKERIHVSLDTFSDFIERGAIRRNTEIINKGTRKEKCEVGDGSRAKAQTHTQTLSFISASTNFRDDKSHMTSIFVAQLFPLQFDFMWQLNKFLSDCMALLLYSFGSSSIAPFVPLFLFDQCIAFRISFLESSAVRN